MEKQKSKQTVEIEESSDFDDSNDDEGGLMRADEVGGHLKIQNTLTANELR